MGKKVAILIVTLLLIGLSILGYYIQQGRKRLLTDPYKAVSASACIVIETADIQNFMNSLTTGKGLFGELSAIKEFSNFNLRLKVFADQVNKQEYKGLLEGSTALLSFYMEDEGKLSAQLSMNIPASIRYRHLREMFRNTGIRNVSEVRSAGTQFLAFPCEKSTGPDSLFFTLNNGLLICNTSRKGAQEAVLQLAREEDIRSVPGFSRVHLASGKNVDKIFIIFPNLTSLIKRLLVPARQEMAEYAGLLAGSAGGDIYISGNGLVLSGYTESTDSSEYLNRYKLINPGEYHTYKVLPAATVLFETIVLPYRNQTLPSSSAIPEGTRTLALKLGQYTGTEVTRALIDIRDQPLADNSLVVIELSNRVAAEQVFTEALGPNPQTEYFSPDDQVRMPVFRTGFAGLTALLKSGYSPGFSETYFAFYDNYLVAGTSYQTVARFLYDNILNKTLGNDINYKDFEGTLPSRGCYYFYCVPSRIIDYLSGYLSGDIIAGFRSNRSRLNKIQAAGLQLAASNGMLYNSLSVRFREEAREESPTEWETLLDTLAAIKPFFFTNHNTGAKEIFIQDLNNNTYLINAAGRVLWKVPLSERITGNIYMIDYFRNGKYQILFAGRDNLHLLDRNGNYVERYPVRLRSPATSPLAIYDYDNNLNYRLFIAGEDKQIYSYDKTGSVVRGWKPFRTAGLVRSEIGYFRVSGKDYIVASDDNSIYFLDRTGNPRMTPRDAVIRARGSAMRLTAGPDPSIVCTAPDGTVQHIFPDGTVRQFSLRKFSPGHTFDVFDINGDGFGEYVFIDKGVLYLYGNDKKELFSRDFGSENLGGPITFIFSSTDRKIGVVDLDRKLIFLINKSGKTIEGFPQRGASMFSIGKLSEKGGWNLIVGGTDRFLYNYRIETGN